MELKEPIEQRRTTVYSKRASDGIRRPVGVAGKTLRSRSTCRLISAAFFSLPVMDISDVMNGNLDFDEDKQHFIPFIQSVMQRVVHA